VRFALRQKLCWRALPAPASRTCRLPRPLEVERLEERTLLSWSTLPSLPTARTDLAATTGADGRIYALGGLDAAGNVLKTVEVYNPTTNAWAAAADLPTARADLAATTGTDGRIYAIGGLGANGFPLATVEVYTPSTDTWVAAANLPTARRGLAAVTLSSGLIYALDGFIRTGGDEGPDFTSNVFEVYTPGTNTWTQATSLPFGGEVTAAVGSDGQMYAMADRTMATYSTTSNSWTLLAGPPFGSTVPQAAPGLDGRIYALGGQLGSSVAAYAPNSKTWNMLASSDSIPTSRSDFAATSGTDGRIYALGGTANDAPLNTAQVFTTDTGGTPNQRFVSQLYRDLLQREAEATGLAFWSGRLDAGQTSRTAVAQAIESSQEYRTDVIQDLYLRLLHRTVDSVGLTAWLQFLGQGNSIEQLEAQIFASTEYFALVGSNDNYVMALYTEILHRAANVLEVPLWTQPLANGASRATIALGILGSMESDLLEVQGLYPKYLRRPVDSVGQSAFVNALQQGTPDEQVAAILLGSDEYFARL
jgi:hypothetical protein